MKLLQTATGLLTIAGQDYRTAEYSDLENLLMANELLLRANRSNDINNILDSIRFNPSIDDYERSILLLKYNHLSFTGIDASPIYSVTNWRLVKKHLSTVNNINSCYLLTSDQKEYLRLLK